MKRPSNEHQHYTLQTKYGTIGSDAPAGAFCKLYYCTGVICLFIFAATLLAIFALWDYLLESVFGLLFLMAFTLAAIIGAYFCLIAIPKSIREAHKELMEEVQAEWSKQDKKYEAWLKAHPHLEEEEFYEKMREAGITSIDSEGQKQKMLICAKKMGIQKDPKALVAAYQLGKQEIERHEQDEKAIDVRRAEKEELKTLLQYSKYQGRERMIQFCKDKVAEFQAIITKANQDMERVKNGATALYNSAKQSETDWALHGGITSAIAGPAAGAARAFEIQQQNAEIRQSNHALAKSAAEYRFAMTQAINKTIRNATDKLNHWNACLQKAELLLVEEVDPSVLLASIKPALTNYTVTESGAIRVELTLERDESLTIFGDTPAVVSGNIEVLILSDTGKTIGSALCVLPVDGLTYFDPTTVNGLCLATTKKYDGYQFKIRPGTLWAQEIMRT